MKPSLSLLLAALGCFLGAAPILAQNRAFTYQGRLTTSGTPANGRYDMQFTLFALESSGNPSSDPITIPDVSVTNGVFTVPLDFGADAFTGVSRWLAIQVRPAGSQNFITLAPRQSITPAPLALTAYTAFSALSVTGVSGYSLRSSDGTIPEAVFVDGAGEVGIGTTEPESKLDVRSGDGSYVRVDNVNGDMRVNGGSDGHWGIFNDGPATGGTHLIGDGQTRLFVANTGNVGIGTTAPQAKLDVRGEVRLGPNGQFKAASGEESLRIVRGWINKDGTINQGSGFQVDRTSAGRYKITFDTPFAGRPCVTAAVDYFSYFDNDSVTVMLDHPPSTAGAALKISFPGGTANDADFNFIAIGPR